MTFLHAILYDNNSALFQADQVILLVTSIRQAWDCTLVSYSKLDSVKNRKLHCFAISAQASPYCFTSCIAEHRSNPLWNRSLISIQRSDNIVYKGVGWDGREHTILNREMSMQLKTSLICQALKSLTLRCARLKNKSAFLHSSHFSSQQLAAYKIFRYWSGITLPKSDSY